MEGADISLKNPWTIRIRVYETSIIGYLELNGKYIYFDKDGVVALIADLESVDGVPKIEGINLTTADVKAHKVLPVEDTEIFDSVLTVTSEVKKQELSPDRIVFEGKDVTLYFGQITALLGSGKLDEKIAQIPPILEKLSEKYPDATGTLHLENYSGSGAAISFVPDQKNTEDSGSDSEDSDSDYNSDYDSGYDDNSYDSSDYRFRL